MTIWHNMYLFVCWPFVAPIRMEAPCGQDFRSLLSPQCLKLCLLHRKLRVTFLQHLLMLISVSESSLGSDQLAISAAFLFPRPNLYLWEVHRLSSRLWTSD